jgi:hypothetical protein
MAIGTKDLALCAILYPSSIITSAFRPALVWAIVADHAGGAKRRVAPSLATFCNKLEGHIIGARSSLGELLEHDRSFAVLISIGLIAIRERCAMVSP